MKMFPVFLYREKDLNMKHVPYWKVFIYLVSIISLFCLFSFSYGRIMNLKNLSDYEKEILIVDINGGGDFSQDGLVIMLRDLNVRFPHIVVAQARVETGIYKSKVFRENNNLFGMKQATVRVNTAQGTQHNHAYYDTWRESVYDYAFYQTRYLSGAKSEEEYLYVLGQSYAEDPNYIEKLKSEIKRNNLRGLF